MKKIVKFIKDYWESKRKYKKLLKITKDILDLNHNAALSGTLMLKLRGIDVGREPGDIDILLFNDYAPHINLPEYIDTLGEEVSSDGNGVKYKFEGIKVDVLSTSNEPTEIIKGIRCGDVNRLIDAKITYSGQDHLDAIKHSKDIKKLSNLGYKLVHLDQKIANKNILDFI